MKKYMKLISALLVLPLAVLMFVSCADNDSYSLDKSWVSMVTVNKLADNSYDFTVDDGQKLWIAAPLNVQINPKYARAIVNYTILSDEINGYDHYIKLNQYYDVLTKGVIFIGQNDATKQDSIGNSPIKVYSAWEGGGYLNIRFGFYAGGVNSHMLNLISSSADLGVNENVVKLEFRHNQKGDPATYFTDGYVSFNLAPYKISGRSKVTFEVTSIDYDGVKKTYTVVYDYSATRSSQPQIKVSGLADAPIR